MKKAYIVTTNASRLLLMAPSRKSALKWAATIGSETVRLASANEVRIMSKWSIVYQTRIQA